MLLHMPQTQYPFSNYNAMALSNPSNSTILSSTSQRTRQALPINPFLARTESTRWSILSSRSCPPSAIPPFIYGVISTKIYCRPTCPARLARRANVVFFDTAAEAEVAGFRACKRCRPDVSTSADTTSPGLGKQKNPLDTESTSGYVAPGDGESGRKKVVKAVEIVKYRAARGERISLADLGKEVGLSKWHLLRIFRKRMGVSPKELADGEMSTAVMLTSGTRPTDVTIAEVPSRSVTLGEDEDTDDVSTISGSITTMPSSGSPATPVLPYNSAFDGSVLTFEEALRDFEAMELDLNQSGLWTSGDENIEDMLRDLFPEIYDCSVDRLGHERGLA